MGHTTSGVARDVRSGERGRATPLADADALDEVLRSYFTGRRNAARKCRFLPVKLGGRHGDFHGMAVDLSRTGMLLRITDEDFAAPDERDQLMPYTARVWDHFEEGIAVKFEDAGIEAVAEPVRVTGYCGRGRNIILVGCRFEQPLDTRDCARLGLEPAGDAE